MYTITGAAFRLALMPQHKGCSSYCVHTCLCVSNIDDLTTGPYIENDSMP